MTTNKTTSITINGVTYESLDHYVITSDAVRRAAWEAHKNNINEEIILDTTDYSQTPGTERWINPNANLLDDNITFTSGTEELNYIINNQKKEREEKMNNKCTGCKHYNKEQYSSEENVTFPAYCDLCTCKPDYTAPTIYNHAYVIEYYNKGKKQQFHGTYTGTHDDFEDFIQLNHYMLLGHDYMEAEDEDTSDYAECQGLSLICEE